MICIDRGIEPAGFPIVRANKLAALRALGRDPTSDDISGYRVVAWALWKAQHYKCCYCERKVMRDYNDVEHYRPKAAADRKPGCNLTHGYWWLAFSWDNLLFACDWCNRSSKRSRFPLDGHSVSLIAEGKAPGGEVALLLDPACGVNPVEHIVFEEVTIGGRNQWWARPRAASLFGNYTIDVCGMNDQQHLDLRDDYYDCIIAPQIKNFEDAFISARAIEEVEREYLRACELLRPKQSFVGFCYDVLRHYVPDAKLFAMIQKKWPVPSEVGK